MSTLTGLKQDWAKFEAWVHSWWPGLKTEVTSGLGALGMGATALMDYLQVLPLNQLVEAKTIALVSMGLLTLSYWFSGMGQRVAARVVTPSTTS